MQWDYFLFEVFDLASYIFDKCVSLIRSFQKEAKELKVKLGVEMEKNKQLVADLEKAKESKDNLDSKVTLVMWLMQL